MKKLVLPFFFFCLSSLQGCYTTEPYESRETDVMVTSPIDIPQVTPVQPSLPANTLSASPEQAAIYNVFLRSMQYQGLDKPQQKIACIQLKQDYQTLADWQTAWLLVYATNTDFSCIPLKRTIELLQILQDSAEMPTQLQWLNNQQMALLNQLAKTQKEKARSTSQLKKAQSELETVNAKIDALKDIETDISKKLDDAEMELEQESDKIEALKDIETDLNKKLDE